MIRIATRADLPRISEIRGAVRENMLSNPAKITDTVAFLIDRDGFWVFETDGHIHGFSSADPRDGSIFALFMDRASEGRGMARDLLAAACVHLAAAGHGRAWLTTDPGTRADRFYRRQGWTETGRTPEGEVRFEKALR
ncbi:GNAT family N-acetyltransferase [Phreatobacter sp.]|uniref:GNAT family N-acetyltransferase n=1 Tax=Phreatobacter sp. TaxID=1966341 RepID=UPI0022BBFD29|nr:GNAT family N-acetyltransferase [Phreatobacter sp.]MCZ8313311.1 GNAT family N-acetyltransferase [Phreatobacter sp.]